jgi:probable DNA repair protein
MPTDYQSRFQQAVKAALSGATVLTANTRSARCVLTACEQHLRPQKVWKTPSVLPISAWLQKSWSDAQARGATEKTLLRHVQELQLWEQIIERTGGMGELLRPASAAPEAMQAWRLLHAYRIPRTSSAFAATRQSREFLDWSKAYEKLCQDRGFIDGATLPNEVLSLLRQTPELAPKQILAWGFDEIAPQQAALFAGLEQIGVDCSSTTEAVASADRNPLRVELPDAEQEFITAAQWARAQLESGPDKRIAIVVPALAGVRASVERVFLRELNPEFFGGVDAQRAFEISLGPALSSYPVVRTATLILRLATEPLPFVELRELLTSAYLGAADTEASARARLVALLSEFVPEKVSLAMLLDRMSREKFREIACPRLRSLLRDFNTKVTAIPPRAAYGQWTRIAHGLLQAFGWPAESDSHHLSSTEYQSTQKWRELLSEVASLELVSPLCSARKAFATILSRAASTVFAPENRAAAVQILGEAEAAGSVFDAVWVCGLTDESWPPRRRANSFIPASLQLQAGVPGSAPDSSVASAKLMLARLIDSAPEVVLSSPVNDSDRVLRASSLVSDIPVQPTSVLALSSAPRWEEMPAATCEIFQDNTAPSALAEDLLHRGTSVLEKQSNCPFRAFAESRLEATRIEEPPAGIRPTDRGNTVERALQLIWEALHDQHQLHSIASVELQTIIENAVDSAIAERLDATGDALRVRIGQIERERLIRLLHEWLLLERKRDNFEVLKHQQPIEITLGGMPLKGFIDRIDRGGEGFVVLDYKAGLDYGAKHWKLPRPQRPQLPIYAVALKQQGKEVAGLSFAKVSTGKCELAGLAVRPEILAKDRQTLERYTEGRSFAEQLEAWEVELTKLASDHLAGHAAVDPKNPPSTGGKQNSSCTYCPLDALCRVAELALASEGDDDE